MMKKKIFGLIPALIIAFSTFCNTAMAEEPVYVLAASDFQARGSDIPAENDIIGAQYMTNILNKMESVGGYTTFDGFLFCGDYTQTTEKADASAGLAKVDELIGTRYPECEDRFYVQGNHDPADTVGLSAFGENDTEDYGVFVIHEDNYPHNQRSATAYAATNTTATALKEYLGAKIDEQYKKPIFIISHLPLHYNRRTIENANAVYGNLLYNVIDEAAEYGLNIVYLFGHNHSSTYDYFIGDHAIYLEAGDEITVAQSSPESVRTEKLNFIYMNAGYVGYTASRAEKELTMTVFKLEDDKITVERYNNAGKYNLKNAGTSVSEDPELVKADTKVYSSARTVAMMNEPVDWAAEWKSQTDSGYYEGVNGQKGVARFIFKADPLRGRIKETGIAYVKADGTEVARSAVGNSPVFYADITNIAMNSSASYHAKAYCVVGSTIFGNVEKTLWSDVVGCSVDFTKYVESLN